MRQFNWRPLVAPQICLAAVGLLSKTAAADDSVGVSTSTTYQTIDGWVGVVPNSLPSYQATQIINRAVNELGITTLRFDDPFNGNGPGVGPWQLHIDGTNPANANWAHLDTLPGVTYNTAAADQQMTQWILPFEQAVEANGDKFNLITNPSWYYGGSSGTLPNWLLNNAGAYAEYLVSFDEYLRDTYNVTPTFSTIINEAASATNNQNAMTPSLEARIIKAAGPMLAAAGLSTKIDLGAGVGPDVTQYYASDPSTTSSVWKYVGAVSWHNYQGNSANKQAVYQIANAHGAVTTQDETQLATYSTMYDDLTNGNVSYWGQYSITGNAVGTGIQYINAGVDGASQTLPPQYWNWRQVMHYVRPGAIRIAAANSNSSIQTMAFEQSSGPFIGTTVTMYNTGSSGATEDLAGLAPGAKYGVSYSLNSTLTELGIQSAGNAGQLAVLVPAGAVMTVYPYAGVDMAPELYNYSASPAYLKLGSGSSTTLTAAAVDPELDAISYQWSLGSAPGGANVSFENPNAAVTSVNGLSVAGLYTFNVKASDGQKSSTEQVGFNVLNGNQPPILGAVQSREPSGVIQPTLLTAPESSVRLIDQLYYDLEGDSSTFNWSVVSQPSGASAQVAPISGQPQGANATNMTVPGDYKFQLTVFDGTNTETQDLTVTVDPADAHAPTITNAAGTATTPGHGHLSATTADADGDYIVNWWDILTQPDGSNVTFTNQASATSDFAVDMPGTYTFQLSSVDRALSAQSQVISITINSVPEPSSLSILGLGAMGLLPRRRRTTAFFGSH